jgi:hypothetical protein
MAAAFYLIASLAMGQGIFSAPPWLFPVLAVVAITNAGCAYALFLWKKWGFYGLLVTAAISITVNLINGASVFHALLGLVGVVVLFILLNIGTQDNGWEQLE